MRVLVTGGAGYLGSVVSRTLLQRGHQVRVLDSLMHGGDGVLGLYEEDGFEFTRGDIRSAGVMAAALEGVDAVVHLAAIVGDPACARAPDLAKEVNLECSAQLFELCRRHGVGRVVFASTCSNYGKMADPQRYATEETELRPVSLYAETKVAAEKAVLAMDRSSGTSPTILRFSTLFGLSPRMRFDLTVNEFTLELLVKRRLVVYGEQFWRPYVHVRDAAAAVALVLDCPPKKVEGQVFNVGDTSQNYRKGRLVDLIRQEIGLDVEIENVGRQEDPRDYRASFEKISRNLGFEITRTVKDGVRQVADAIGQAVITDFDSPKYRNLQGQNG